MKSGVISLNETKEYFEDFKKQFQDQIWVLENQAKGVTKFISAYFRHAALANINGFLNKIDVYATLDDTTQQKKQNEHLLRSKQYLETHLDYEKLLVKFFPSKRHLDLIATTEKLLLQCNGLLEKLNSVEEQAPRKKTWDIYATLLNVVHLKIRVAGYGLSVVPNEGITEEIAKTNKDEALQVLNQLKTVCDTIENPTNEMPSKATRKFTGVNSYNDMPQADSFFEYSPHPDKMKDSLKSFSNFVAIQDSSTWTKESVHQSVEVDFPEPQTKLKI